MRNIRANGTAAKEAKSNRTAMRGRSKKEASHGDLQRWLLDYLMEGVTQRFGFAGMEAGEECVDILYGQMRCHFRSEHTASLTKFNSID